MEKSNNNFTDPSVTISCRTFMSCWEICLEQCHSEMLCWQIKSVAPPKVPLSWDAVCAPQWITESNWTSEVGVKNCFPERATSWRQGGKIKFFKWNKKKNQLWKGAVPLGISLPHSHHWYWNLPLSSRHLRVHSALNSHHVLLILLSFFAVSPTRATRQSSCSVCSVLVLVYLWKDPTAAGGHCPAWGAEGRSECRTEQSSHSLCPCVLGKEGKGL